MSGAAHGDVRSGPAKADLGAPGVGLATNRDDRAAERTSIAVDVLEEVLGSRATRFAWLLGFITGSALAEGAADADRPTSVTARG